MSANSTVSWVLERWGVASNMGHDSDCMLAGVERGQAVVVCFELSKDIPEADNIYIQVCGDYFMFFCLGFMSARKRQW